MDKSKTVKKETCESGKICLWMAGFCVFAIVFQVFTVGSFTSTPVIGLFISFGSLAICGAISEKP